MRLYFAVIGFPLAQSKSPALYKGIFKELKLAADYEKLELDERGFSDFWNGAYEKYRGLNITIPYKKEAFAFISNQKELLPLRAVNCLLVEKRGLKGFNTDVYGIEKALRDVDFCSKKILLLGSGGAAQAFLTFLRSFGNFSLEIVSRDKDQCRRLCLQFGLEQTAISEWPEIDFIELMRHADIIVNATPLGMYGYNQKLAIERDVSLKGKVVFDMVYNPQKTFLLEYAARNGALTISGLEMFLYQAQKNLQLFFDLEVDYRLLKQVYFSGVEK